MLVDSQEEDQSVDISEKEKKKKSYNEKVKHINYQPTILPTAWHSV